MGNFVDIMGGVCGECGLWLVKRVLHQGSKILAENVASGTEKTFWVGQVGIIKKVSAKCRIDVLSSRVGPDSKEFTQALEIAAESNKTEPEIEFVVADWKEYEDVITRLLTILRKNGFHIRDYGRGSDMYAYAIKKGNFTKDEIAGMRH